MQRALPLSEGWFVCQGLCAIELLAYRLAGIIFWGSGFTLSQRAFRVYGFSLWVERLEIKQ